MKQYRRWLAALLVSAMTTAASLPGTLALPNAFAELRIDASHTEIPDWPLSVTSYLRDKTGRFQPSGTEEYRCRLNQADQDASFFIQPNAEGVWVSVDYLTDVNGDGIYELLEDAEAPLWDVMDTQGNLMAQGAAPPLLAAGQPYILSSAALIRHSQQAVQSRLSGGSCALDVGQDPAGRQKFPLCMIRLHRTNPSDGLEHEQTYYIQIGDNVHINPDVSPSDWYYDAVYFVLSRGYLAGSSNGLFLPNGQLSRAELAQVLWAMGGRPEPQSSPRFRDVSDTDWFYRAASWCQQESLIAGYSEDCFAPNDFLTWEQLVTVLYRYAQRSGASLWVNANLSQFKNGGNTAPWAVESMRWAVTHNLIPIENNTLYPAAVVTRAELASALYSYAVNFESYGQDIPAP